MRTPLRERLDDRSQMVIGVLIVMVSIFGAWVTWLASGAAGSASDFDQRARQAALLRDQITNEHRTAVAYEERLFTAFREHVAAANQLEREAEADPSAAPELLEAAKERRAIARSLELPFRAAPVVSDGAFDPKARASYDARAEMAALLRSEPRLSELRPLRLRDAAGDARAKRLALVATDTAVIAAIFFLTLSLLAARYSRQLALVGVLLVGASAVGFVLIQVLVEVPVV
jgi:hypothetical protein